MGGGDEKALQGRRRTGYVKSHPNPTPFRFARAVRVLEAEFALAALVGDYNDTDMATRLQRPNSTSSASGFLMCSLITRAIGRAPISSSSAET
jgi:hypothetical protein